MGFPKQEYWSGLPFPSPGDLPHPGIKPGSPALQAYALTSEPPGKHICKYKLQPCSHLAISRFIPVWPAFWLPFFHLLYRTTCNETVISPLQSQATHTSGDWFKLLFMESACMWYTWWWFLGICVFASSMFKNICRERWKFYCRVSSFAATWVRNWQGWKTGWGEKMLISSVMRSVTLILL